jgi:SpoVK/Ycf46/Vps4 family AAA+-type ATPase
MLSSRTAGLSSGDLDNVIADSLRFALQHQHQSSCQPQQLVSASSIVTDEFDDLYASEEEIKAHELPSGAPDWQLLRLLVDDVEAALNCAQQRASSTAGTIARVPNVTWADVGGLGNAKAEILDTIELPLRHPQLFASGLKQVGHWLLSTQNLS